MNCRLCLGEICVATIHSTIFETEQHRARGNPYRYSARALAMRVLSLRAHYGSSRVIPVRQLQRSLDGPQLGGGCVDEMEASPLDCGVS